MIGLAEKRFPMILAQLLSATQGKLIQGKGVEYEGVSIDTRTLKPGAMYIAIQGERLDGHHFVQEAFSKGARGVIIASNHSKLVQDMSEFTSSGRFVIEVPDTLRALQDIAFFHRCQFDLPLVGVTGTNGKTSTKEMIASIFQERWCVHKNAGNLNNHIGVPLTLLNLESKHQASVIEMGVRGSGELKRLCEMALPSVGVITNIGSAHLETLGSLEGVARAKGELLEGLKEDSLFVLNADDPFLVKMVSEKKRLRTLSFGMVHEADVVGEEIPSELHQGERFTIKIREGEIDVSLPLFGRHHILNALASSAVALGLGFGLGEIKRGLEKIQGVGMRMEISELSQGIHVINDAYNANPNSVKAALETLIRLSGKGSSIAVLGDMLELGKKTEAFHQEIGEQVTRGEIDFLITVGEKAHHIAKSALKMGMDPNRVWTVTDLSSATQRLLKCLQGGEWVLVKGSRRLGLEQIVADLTKAYGRVEGIQQ